MSAPVLLRQNRHRQELFRALDREDAQGRRITGIALMVHKVAQPHHCVAVVLSEWCFSRVLRAVDTLSHEEVRSKHGPEYGRCGRENSRRNPEASEPKCEYHISAEGKVVYGDVARHAADVLSNVEEGTEEGRAASRLRCAM
jgi:hypothetical protein